MLLSNVGTRVEDLHLLVGEWIDSRQIRAFEQIALWTRIAKVINIVGSAMLEGNAVFDMKRETKGRLGNAAEFATSVSTLPNKLTRRCVHGLRLLGKIRFGLGFHEGHHFILLDQSQQLRPLFVGNRA